VRDVAGATIVVAPPPFRLTAPLVDAPILGGAAQLTADRGRAILRVPDVGSFAIAGGSDVWLDAEPGADEDATEVWLHGTVAALVLAQQGRFALHASVVEVEGFGVALAGLRGAGKSTTALRLGQLGHRVVTDDVSPLRLGGGVYVEPFGRPVHVDGDTAARLGLDVAEARPLLHGHPKLALTGRPTGPARLRAIAVLEAGEEAGVVALEPVHGAAAHWLTQLNVYRVDVLQELWAEELFAWAGSVAAGLAVFRITRPAAGWTVDDVVGIVAGIPHAAAQQAP
jgi:hypothetical protein